MSTINGTETHHRMRQFSVEIQVIRFHFEELLSFAVGRCWWNFSEAWNVDTPVLLLHISILCRCRTVVTHDSLSLWQHLNWNTLQLNRFTHLWGQRTYLLTAFLACFAKIVLGAVQSCLHSEHDVLYFKVNTLLLSDHTVQCSPVESACTTTTPPVFRTFSTSVPFVHARTRWVKTSSL